MDSNWHTIHKMTVLGTGVIGSGFWLGLLLLITEMVVGTMLIVVHRWYKKGKREDVLPNEHIFAESLMILWNRQ